MLKLFCLFFGVLDQTSKTRYPLILLQKGEFAETAKNFADETSINAEAGKFYGIHKLNLWIMCEVNLRFCKRNPQFAEKYPEIRSKIRKL